MDEFKGLLSSKTFYGVVISLIAKIVTVATPYTIDAATEAEIVQLVALAVSFCGDGLTVYGRIKATKKIG